jgi:hypothetical protein
MTRPLLIGICSSGPGCGKSTVAQHLERHGFRVVPFAQPLKRIVATLLTEAGYSGIDAWKFVTDAAAKARPLELIPGNPTPRRLLQITGTEWGRGLVHEDLWVELWRRQVERHLGIGYHVVADDLRFPDEAAAVRELGGLVLYLERPGVAVDLQVVSHASEGALPRTAADWVMSNDSTIQELIAQVDAWLEDQL